MKSVIVIIPFFGPFPKMFPFWLQSAYDNPTIDFLIVTDNEIQTNRNIKVVFMPFDELKGKIQILFDFPINIPSPYKLCDFKGVYGVIFSEYVKDYDYWGFGDIDLVYGNIRQFLTSEILHNYWVISGWGHFTLYKNNEICNNFFKTHLDGYQYYKDVFSCPINSAFDEFNHQGLSEMWKILYPEKLWNTLLFDDVRVPRLSFNFVSEFHPECSMCLIFEYENGNLFRVYKNLENRICKEPILYAHFQQRKFMKILTSNFNSYLIVPNEFINYEVVTEAKLNWWGRDRKTEMLIWNLKQKAKYKLKKIAQLLD